MSIEDLYKYEPSPRLEKEAGDLRGYMKNYNILKKDIDLDLVLSGMQTDIEAEFNEITKNNDNDEDIKLAIRKILIANGFQDVLAEETEEEIVKQLNEDEKSSKPEDAENLDKNIDSILMQIDYTELKDKNARNGIKIITDLIESNTDFSESEQFENFVNGLRTNYNTALDSYKKYNETAPIEKLIERIKKNLNFLRESKKN